MDSEINYFVTEKIGFPLQRLFFGQIYIPQTDCAKNGSFFAPFLTFRLIVYVIVESDISRNNNVPEQKDF